MWTLQGAVKAMHVANMETILMFRNAVLWSITLLWSCSAVFRLRLSSNGGSGSISAILGSHAFMGGLRSAIAAYRDLTFIIHTFGCWVQRLYTQLFALASCNTLCVRSIAHPPLSWQRRSRRSRCRSENGPWPRFWWPWFLFKRFLGFAGHLFLSIFFLWIHQTWGIYTENLPLYNYYSLKNI